MRFFELIYLFRIQDMNLSVKRCQSDILLYEVHKMVSINRGCFETNQNSVKGMRSQYRKNSFHKLRGKIK